MKRSRIRGPLAIPKVKVAPTFAERMDALDASMPLRGCQYHTGEGFCGSRRAPGRAWCPEHLAVVYR